MSLSPSRRSSLQLNPRWWARDHMPSFWLDRHLTPAPSSTPQGIDRAIFALASCCCNPPIELVHHLHCRRALMLKPRRPAWMRALDLGMPQLRDAQLQRAEPGVERAVAVAVAPGGALAAALVTPAPIIPSTSLSISNCSTASATARRKSPSPAFSSKSARACFRLRFGNSTLADLARWPPQLHRSPTLMEY
jgi:hypothetical protein